MAMARTARRVLAEVNAAVSAELARASCASSGVGACANRAWVQVGAGSGAGAGAGAGAVAALRTGDISKVDLILKQTNGDGPCVHENGGPLLDTTVTQLTAAGLLQRKSLPLSPTHRILVQRECLPACWMLLTSRQRRATRRSANGLSRQARAPKATCR